MTKQKIMDKLTAAGIDFDPKAKMADLKALLPEQPEASEEAPEPAIRVEVDDDKAVIYGKGGEVIRVYSEDLHGERFAELAEEYANKLSSK